MDDVHQGKLEERSKDEDSTDEEPDISKLDVGNPRDLDRDEYEDEVKYRDEDTLQDEHLDEYQKNKTKVFRADLLNLDFYF